MDEKTAILASSCAMVILNGIPCALWRENNEMPKQYNIPFVKGYSSA